MRAYRIALAGMIITAAIIGALLVPTIEANDLSLLVTIIVIEYVADVAATLYLVWVLIQAGGRTWIAMLVATSAIIITVGLTVSVFTFLAIGATVTSADATALRRIAVLTFGSVPILKAVTVFLVRRGVDG